MNLSRRGFLFGIAAAPAIIAIDKLMPLHIPKPDPLIARYGGWSGIDAGFFYCPYIPLQMTDATTFQPKVGFNTRYGMVANPYG